MKSIIKTISILVITLVVILASSCTIPGLDNPGDNPGNNPPTLEDYLVKAAGTWYLRPASYSMGDYMMTIDVQVTGTVLDVDILAAYYRESYAWKPSEYDTINVDSFIDNNDGTITFISEYVVWNFDEASGSLDFIIYEDLEHTVIDEEITLHRTLGTTDYILAVDIYEAFIDNLWYMATYPAPQDNFFYANVTSLVGETFYVTIGRGYNYDSDIDGIFDDTQWSFYGNYTVEVLGIHDGDNSQYETYWVGPTEEFYAVMSFPSLDEYILTIYANDTYTNINIRYECFLDYAQAGVITPVEIVVPVSALPTSKVVAKSVPVKGGLSR